MKKPCLRRAQGTSEKHGVKNGCSGLCGGSAPLRSPSDGDRPLEGPSAFVTNMTKKLGTDLEVEGALKDQLLVCGGLRRADQHDNARQQGAIPVFNTKCPRHLSTVLLIEPMHCQVAYRARARSNP
jgi:hypothetical protein